MKSVNDGKQYQSRVKERLRQDFQKRLDQEKEENEMLTYCHPNITQAISLGEGIAINPMQVLTSNVRVENKIKTFKQNQRINRILKDGVV